MDSRRLIGITGYKGSGKDTLAKTIAREYDGVTIYRFADPIKEVVSVLFGWEIDKLNFDYEYKESSDDPYCRLFGMSRRQMLQKIGTECFRNGIDDDFWVKLLMTRIEHDSPPIAVITDVRFPNEARAIKESGGLIIRVRNPRVTNQDDTHPSETNIDSIPYDIEVLNEMKPFELPTALSEYLEMAPYPEIV